MTLSIVIVNFNGGAHIGNCLASLDAAPPSTPHDIVVVDNASTDGSPDDVRRRWPQIRLIALEKNLGFSAGNNAGIRATTGEFVLLLNNDTVVGPGSLDRLLDRLRAHPDAAVAGPRLVSGDGRLEISFGPMLSPLAELRQKALGQLYDRGIAVVERYVARRAAAEQYVDWVSGACLLVYRRDAEAAGLLDERYFLYTEDVDFCAAIRARGRKILFTPRVQITHLRGKSRSTAPRVANAAYRRSQIAFYEKHHPNWAPILKAYLRMKGALPD
jgi:N-acetylglucosaminyl-diphospho-decaprenol L-rhamnosyltransferase